MDDRFNHFLKGFPPVPTAELPTAGAVDNYRKVLPARLLAYWQEYGWRGFGKGRFWLTDPSKFRSIVELWCAESALNIETLHVIARNAFGELIIWAEDHGKAAVIKPFDQSVFTFPPNRYLLGGDPDRALASIFGSLSPSRVDYRDDADKPLFDRALAKLGPVEADEMYAFEPALVLGGRASIENLVKVDMLAHLTLLAQLDDIEVDHIDTSMHTGG